MIGLLIVMVVMAVPIAGIVSSTYLKAKRLEADGAGGANIRAELAAIRRENADLRARVEVLETIATDGALNDAQKSVEELKELEQAAARSR